jgi:large subunit ribosomal protein L22
VDAALDILRNCQKGVASSVYKLLDSAVANVQESELDWDLDRLVISRAWVDEGPTMRRFRPRAMGRATRIRKRTSHIHIELNEG